jgi:hypothetical protein
LREAKREKRAAAENCTVRTEGLEMERLEKIKVKIKNERESEPADNE